MPGCSLTFERPFYSQETLSSLSVGKQGFAILPLCSHLRGLLLLVIAS